MKPAKAAALFGIVVFLTIWMTLTAMGIERDLGTYSLVAAVVTGILVYMAMKILAHKSWTISEGGWTASAIISTAISVIGIVVTIVTAIIQHQNTG